MKCRNDYCEFNEYATRCILRRRNIVLSNIGVCTRSNLTEMLLMTMIEKYGNGHAERFDVTDNELIQIACRLLKMAEIKFNRENPEDNEPDFDDDDYE